LVCSLLLLAVVVVIVAFAFADYIQNDLYDLISLSPSAQPKPGQHSTTQHSPTPTKRVSLLLFVLWMNALNEHM